MNNVQQQTIDVLEVALELVRKCEDLDDAIESLETLIKSRKENK